MTTFLYAILACLVLCVLGTFWTRVSMRRIAASRVGENFDTFQTAFAPEQIPPDVLRTVYAKFQEWSSDAMAAFPVRADDDIGHIYGMVDEDLDEAVLAVLEACGRQPPPEEHLGRMRPIVTVRDFVRFVAECPADPNQLQQTGA